MSSKPLSDITISRLQRAWDFIVVHFKKNPTLPAIAEQAGLSNFYLHRLFTRHFGKRPKDLVDELRIGAAKEMLARGDSIMTVVKALGFAHQSHFTSRFKQLVGETPARWVREKKKDPPATQR